MAIDFSRGTLNKKAQSRFLIDENMKRSEIFSS